MPYLNAAAKTRWSPLVENMKTAVDAGVTAGDLNYLVTMLTQAWLAAVSRESGVRYDQLNSAVGALESAKAEFQRRVVAPYEDRKIAENGDVY